MYIRFAMVSKAIFFLTILISVECRIVPSVNSRISSIPLSELLSTFKSTGDEIVAFHLVFMLLAASYGDRMYNLPVDVSAKCGRTARAVTLMLKKLAIDNEDLNAVAKALYRTTRDLQKRTELTEHPLEPFCRQIEGKFAHSNLKKLFEKAKQYAGFTTVISAHPAYFKELIEQDDFDAKIIDKLEVPEFARVMAFIIFRLAANGNQEDPEGWTLFAKSCQEVAKQERFASVMQSIFEKTIDDVLSEMMNREMIEKYKSNPADLWCMSSMPRIMYGYIAKYPTLKKEVDDMAPTVDQFGDNYWDFSDLCTF